MKFQELIATLSQLHTDLQAKAIRAINTSLTLRNWSFGLYIVEFEQDGQDRAQYGTNLLAVISKAITADNIPNTNERELRRYRQFYQTYPQLSQYIVHSNIRGILPPELNLTLPIRGMTSPEFEIPLEHTINLCHKLSYSHFVELIRLEDPYQRLFYELEAIKGTWSVKELKRQIGSLFYERTGLSKNKGKILALVQQNEGKEAINDWIRDPYVFEFIGLKNREVLEEKQLEQAILDHLTQFLLELGKGFCFEARQKRIVIDNEHHFVDMVFYHRILHCNVLIELKTERFHHSHSGQLNMYLEYYKKYEMTPGDNPPVGILLCTDKDQEHVEFATAGMDQKLFVAKYLVEMPDKKDLERFIKLELKQLKECPNPKNS
jgi:predicted nuclease of restriction endonuclease-like (RecB) superfamily